MPAKARTSADEEDDQELLDGSDQDLEDHVFAAGCHDSEVGAGSDQLEVHSGAAEDDSQADVELGGSDQEVVLDSAGGDVVDVIVEDVCEVLVVALETPVGMSE